MLFVRVGRYHVNMDNVIMFEWLEGRLSIDCIEVNICLDDPDRSHYKKLCESIGVRPVEEE